MSDVDGNREPAAPAGRRMVVLRAMVLLVVGPMLGVACGCATRATAAVPHVDDSLHVVLQVGEYDWFGGPDLYVSGPELVVYGDGTVYAEILSEDGRSTRLVTGRMELAALTRVLRDAFALPADAPPDRTADAGPLLLVVGDRTWEIGEPMTGPFADYLVEVRATVRHAATRAWRPLRWVERPFGQPCTVASLQLADVSGYDAPVYPHVLARFPLGDFDCAVGPHRWTSR